ncbi:hypothetical protein [Frankia sp. CiP3]|uniref:hypothetical protein n=1 Tax=Frankia sp. CiP3 TaxID=2880971 RepID=UPI001EF3DFC4|nr:hypothetical protein [Frankia sp. CiP3]
MVTCRGLFDFLRDEAASWWGRLDGITFLTLAVFPLSGTKLRDSGVRTPGFVVIGNGRATVIEIDGRAHYGATCKADDHTHDRHWERCGVHTIRISSEHTADPRRSRRYSARTSFGRSKWSALTTTDHPATNSAHRPRPAKDISARCLSR